jgi:hypothetical protein
MILRKKLFRKAADAKWVLGFSNGTIYDFPFWGVFKSCEVSRIQS